MNTKLISFWIAIFISMLSSAQNINLVSTIDVTHNGIGNPATSTQINVGNGKNRVIIAYYFIERDHRPGNSTSTFNDNKPMIGLSTDYFENSPTINSQPMFGRSSSYGDYIFTANEDFVRFSGYGQQYIYIVPDNLSGNVQFNHNITNPAKTSADDLVIKIAVFENVSQKSMSDNFTTCFAKAYGIVSNATITASNISSINLPVLSGIPSIGRSASEIYYYGIGASVQQESLNLVTSDGWKLLSNTNLSNSSGSTFNNGNDGDSNTNANAAAIAINHESDGITVNSVGLTGVTTAPNIIFNRANNKYVPFLRFHGITLLPLAKPQISGNVYRDVDGLPNINGTGTNFAASYINVVNNLGIVVYVANVSSSGSYTVPSGFVVEGNNYTLQLSNVQGIINQVAPQRILNPGYSTVGESAGTTTGNDNQPDGSISVNIGFTNLTNYNFGINVCNAGSAAPPVKNLSFSCPTLNINLNLAHTGTIPSNSTLVWFNNNNHTGTALSSTQVSQATPGIYYAFYYDNVAACFSPASNPAVVNQICATNDNYNVTSPQAISGVNNIGNALLNDIYNTGSSTSANISNVNISVITPAASIGGSPVPTLNISTGNVIIPAGIATGNYTITYQICDKTDVGICSTASITIVVANVYCYKTPLINSGTTIPTKQGITALNRANENSSSWPNVRQSGWTVLESKTKGFVVNRVAFNTSGNPIGIPQTNFIEGMMVYDTKNNCLKIYNGTIWSCYTTPACPDTNNGNL